MPSESPRGRQRRLRADFNRRNRRSQAMGGAIRMDLLRGIRSFRRNVDFDDVMRAIRTGKMSEVLRTVPWSRLDKALQPAARGLASAGEISASAAFAELPFDRGLQLSTLNPKLVQYVESRTGELIKTVQDGMLASIRQSVRRSFDKALRPQQVANEIRSSIGLNVRQVTALGSYRNKLEAGGTSAAQVKKLTDAYAERLLDQRAIMIARTEVRFANNAGEQAVWQRAKDQGLLPETTKRVWVVDGNPCPELCLPMDGVKVGLDEPWVLPDGRAVDNPTSSHPHCFCIASLDFTGQT